MVLSDSDPNARTRFYRVVIFPSKCPGREALIRRKGTRYICWLQSLHGGDNLLHMGKAQLLHSLFPDLFCRLLPVCGVIESSKSAIDTVSYVARPSQSPWVQREGKWKADSVGILTARSRYSWESIRATLCRDPTRRQYTWQHLYPLA